MMTERTLLNVDDGGAGEPAVLFVHSAAGSVKHWRRQLEHLRARRRAVAIDLRGHGASGARAARNTTIEEFAEDVAHVADELELARVVLVGHSMGGAVCAAYAAKHPDRVAGLLLLDPASDGRQIPREQAEGYLAALADEQGYLPTVEAYWEPMLAPSRPEVRDLVLGGLRRTPQDTIYATLSSLLTFDPVAALSRFRGPKRSVITQFNEDEMAYHRLVPDLPHEKLEGVGHWLQLDAPDQVNAVIDRFLVEVDRVTATRR